MATFQEILADRTAYPDEREITMPDGAGNMVKVSLGDLRNQVIPKGDYTKETQRFAQEKQQLEQQYRAQLGQFAQQLQALNAELDKRNQPPIRSEEDFNERFAADANDPTLGPYAKLLRKMAKEVEEVRRDKEDIKKQLAQHEQAFWINQHSQVLKQIQDRDEDFRNPTKTQELIAYAQQRGLANLDLAYQLMTRDRDIERAKDTARKEAESKVAEQTKINQSQPHIPGGEKGTTTGIGQGFVPPKDSLDPFEDAANMAKADPDLEAIGAKFAADYAGR